MNFFLTRINNQDFNLCDLNTWKLLNQYGEDWEALLNHALQDTIELYETTNEDQHRIVQFLIQFAYLQGAEDAETCY